MSPMLSHPVLVTLVFASALSARAQVEDLDPSKVDKAKPQEAVAAPPPKVSSTLSQEAQVSLGILFNDGNTSSAAGRAGGYYQARVLQHGFRVELAAGLTSVAQDPDGDPSNGYGLPLFDPNNRAATVAGAKLRYDYFLAENDSLYVAALVFHDSAANLLARLRGELGYRHYFFNLKKHSLSGEAGVVYTIDDTPVGVDTNKDGRVDIYDDTQLEETGTIGARFALAYTNALSDNVSYTTTLEIIPNIFPSVDAPFEKARLGGGDNKLGLGEATIAAWTNTLNVSLNQSLSIGVTLNAAWDNGAIARRNAYTNYDIATSVLLSYKLF